MRLENPGGQSAAPGESDNEGDSEEDRCPN